MEIRFNLNPVEQELFDVLLKVAQPLGTNVFAVGGFVRDKLLGKESDDIDIMVDNMSGEKFAHQVTRFLGNKDPHVIRANPEATKNIETAKTYLVLPSGAEVEVDFAQARTDTYDAKTRNPITKPASPKDDAFRRDFTFNALFYNLATKQVEDFTGQGMADLQNHIVRAPGEPIVRFMEDPLRVLRAIRFSARFNWQIDPATFEAMKNPEVLNTLHSKISKERLGIEFEKMLKTPHPDYGLRLLQECGITQQWINDAVKGTEYEGKMSPWTMSQNNVHHKMTLDQHTMKVLQNLLALYSDATPEKRLVMSLSALFHDFGKMFQGIQAETPFGSTSFHGHEDHSSILAELFLKYVKLDKYIPQVKPMALQHMRPHVLVEDSGAKAVRRLLRDLAEDGVHWVDLLNHAQADATAKGETLDDEDRLYISRMNTFREQVKQIEQEMSTQSVNLQKPILNGHELMQIFNRNDPGPWIGEVSQWLKDLMLSDVGLTKEIAAEKSKQQFPQHVKQPKTASIASDILLSKRQEQIDGVLKTEPYKAMTLAVALWKAHPDDERTLLLCVKTAMTAKQSSGQSVYSEEIYEAARKLANDRIFNPEIISSFLGYKTLMGKDLTEEDVLALKRAMTMDRGITNKVANLVCSIGGDSQWIKLWNSVQNEDNITKEAGAKLYGS